MTVVVSVERLLNWKSFPLRHCVVSLIENLALGESMTVIFLLIESIQPAEEFTIRLTVYVPDLVYDFKGFRAVRLVPSPNFHT